MRLITIILFMVSSYMEKNVEQYTTNMMVFEAFFL